MASIIGIEIGDFLKSLWVDAKKIVKKFWFKINFKSVNFGFDNVYQKRIFKKRLYCFVCGENGKATPLSYDKGYAEWDHKCDICKKTVNVRKKINIKNDCIYYKRK